MVVEVGVAGAAAMETDDGALNATDPMLARLAPCFFDGVPSGNPQLLSDWRRWMVRYAQRLASEGRPDSERQTEMRLTSPKFIEGMGARGGVHRRRARRLLDTSRAS